LRIGKSESGKSESGKSEIEKMETGTRKQKNGDGMKFYLTK